MVTSKLHPTPRAESEEEEGVELRWWEGLAPLLLLSLGGLGPHLPLSLVFLEGRCEGPEILRAGRGMGSTRLRDLWCLFLLVEGSSSLQALTVSCRFDFTVDPHQLLHALSSLA